MTTLTIATKSKALNVYSPDETSFGRISVNPEATYDLDFKYQEGQGFVSLHKLAHYHNGLRYVLGTQLEGMVAATASEATRALAAESKLSSDISTESSRAQAAEASISQSLASEVSRATTAEGVITAAVAQEDVDRSNVVTGLIPK